MPSTRDDEGSTTDEDETTVLVVDDQPNVANAYELYLSDDHRVRVATGGAEALEMVDETVDVVLLDRRMPEVTGDEVLETIRERGYGCRVAMVTAVDPDFDILDMEFDAYLTKSVTPDEVRETVDRLLTLTDYDDLVRERLALAEKKATLEATKSEAELRESEEYLALVERLDDLASEMERKNREMDTEQFAAAFRDPTESGGE